MSAVGLDTGREQTRVRGRGCEAGEGDWREVPLVVGEGSGRFPEGSGDGRGWPPSRQGRERAEEVRRYGGMAKGRRGHAEAVKVRRGPKAGW